jgi:hypothetical protein
MSLHVPHVLGGLLILQGVGALDAGEKDHDHDEATQDDTPDPQNAPRGENALIIIALPAANSTRILSRRPRARRSFASVVNSREEGAVHGGAS